MATPNEINALLELLAEKKTIQDALEYIDTPNSALLINPQEPKLSAAGPCAIIQDIQEAANADIKTALESRLRDIDTILDSATVDL